MVFKQSGVVVPLPPGFAPRPPPALPPRPRSTVNDESGQEGKGKGKGEEPLGAANWGALWNIMKAPLEKKGMLSRKGSENDNDKAKAGAFEPVDVTGISKSAVTENESKTEGSSPSGEAVLPPSPPKSIRRGVERVDSQAATTPSYPQPEKWEALFEEDATPAPIFIALMSTIFSRLDPEHTGFLSPETYSKFLETQGCVESNIWKIALDREEGEHSKEVADLELSLYFSDLVISHYLSVRIHETAEPPTERPQSAVEGKIRNSMRFNANMPMISRQGFIDVCSIEYLKDPDSAYVWLGKAVKEYGVWSELGEMPRSVLPEKAIPRLSRKKSENETQTETEAENVTPVAEISEQNEDVSAESKKEDTENEKKTSSTSPPETSPKELIQDDTETASSPDKTSPNSKASHSPEPIKILRLASPITLGSPALPIQLKGGEKKIDALAKGEEFELVEGEDAQEKEDITTTTQESEEALDEKKVDVVEKSEEKSKSGELKTKKPSVEDLYGED
ncbi:hypothetical protein ONS96_003253 [Cadophora gregata f. sp. sojae]|nr:hypothetical protein ONS96_003253 [Cadophora gregata f. sp. sojae]